MSDSDDGFSLQLSIHNFLYFFLKDRSLFFESFVFLILAILTPSFQTKVVDCFMLYSPSNVFCMFSQNGQKELLLLSLLK